MTLKTNKSKSKNKQLGFTIVELLVVIVIIGILAAITIVSYTGITKKANESTLQSDLASAKKQFALYYTEHGVYPTGLNGNKCPTGTTNPNPDTNYCLKPSAGDLIEISEADGSKYKLTATKGTLVYTITENSGLAANDPDWITIGTQKWARKNLNVGSMILGTANPINDSNIEKYCFDNLESNCTIYGGLYNWNEAMKWVTAEGSQGICPVGSHIPRDNDWKALEVQLGMSSAMADSLFWRGTGQAAKLKSGGSSGLNIQVAGELFTPGPTFAFMSELTYLWTSSAYGDGEHAWYRGLSASDDNNIDKNADNIISGFYVRCLMN